MLCPKSEVSGLCPYSRVERQIESGCLGSTHDDNVRETKTDGVCIINALDLLRWEGKIQCLDVLLQMIDLPSTNDAEHIWSFVQMVRNCN